MSPYIVTTERELPSAEDSSTLTYREYRAVATLEEAKRAAYRPIDTQRADFAMGPHTYGRLRRIVFDWSEFGGTVGPLPDGTVIEVKPWEDGPMRAWANFYGSADVTSASSPSEIIAAFNTVQP